MASYLFLPLELRQQILACALYDADIQDRDSLSVFRKVLLRDTPHNGPVRQPRIGALIRDYAQVRVPDDPKAHRPNYEHEVYLDPELERFGRVLPLSYAPNVASLLSRLSASHPAIGPDLAFLVNQW